MKTQNDSNYNKQTTVNYKNTKTASKLNQTNADYKNTKPARRYQNN